MIDLSTKRVRDLLAYDPATGLFCWRAGGRTAGTVRQDGYVVIKIDGRNYLAHRLAWFVTNGAWPALIDHIDANPSNNGISNLRIADHSKNKANRGATASNTSGFKGVFVDRRRPGKWFASIKVHGRVKYLGSFDAPEKAHAAYEVAAKSFFGDFARAA